MPDSTNYRWIWLIGAIVLLTAGFFLAIFAPHAPERLAKSIVFLEANYFAAKALTAASVGIAVKILFFTRSARLTGFQRFVAEMVMVLGIAAFWLAVALATGIPFDR